MHPSDTSLLPEGMHYISILWIVKSIIMALYIGKVTDVYQGHRLLLV